jgi:hypothetical protein
MDDMWCLPFAAGGADRNLKLFFDDNAPQSVAALFTNYQPGK